MSSCRLLLATQTARASPKPGREKPFCSQTWDRLHARLSLSCHSVGPFLLTLLVFLLLHFSFCLPNPLSSRLYEFTEQQVSECIVGIHACISEHVLHLAPFPNTRLILFPIFRFCFSVEWSAKLNVLILQPDSLSENIAAVSWHSDCKYKSCFHVFQWVSIQSPA